MTSADPKSVKVNLTTGTGMDIEWKDGHRSHYSFTFLRDACPCAMCNEERQKSDREPGEPPDPSQSGPLPMFKPIVKPTSAEGVANTPSNSTGTTDTIWEFIPGNFCGGLRLPGVHGAQAA